MTCFEVAQCLSPFRLGEKLLLLLFLFPREGELIDGFLEVDWVGGLAFEFLSGDWMFEAEDVCVKHLSLGFVAGEFPEVLVLTLGVDFVAGEREADVFEMDADLVSASGVKSDFDQSGFTEILDHLVGRAGIFASAVAGDDHAHAVIGVAGYGRIDLTNLVTHVSAGDCVVDLFDLSVCKLLCQADMGFVILGRDDAAGCVAIQSMNNPRACDSTDSAELSFAMVDQCVDEGVFLISRCDVDKEACLFVDDDQVFVFVEDIQWNVSGLGFVCLGWREVDTDVLSGSRVVIGLHLLAIHLNMAFLDQTLECAA